MLTVAFATHNGAAVLPRALEALARLESPPGGWKLVVVDNGSTDGSRALLDAWAARLPLTVVDEPRRGKNVALNRTLAFLEGDLLVLTDDDVLPRPDWLVALRRAADRETTCAILGGAIVPAWDVPPDPWVLEAVPAGPAWSLTGAWQAGPVAPSRVFGPNMALRASLIGHGLRFDEGIGPAPGAYAMGSETELVRRLVREGHACWHCPDAVVEHIIRPHQMTEAWLLLRAERFGRGQYRLAAASAPGKPATLLGRPRWMYRAWLECALGVLAASASRSRTRRFRARWALHELRGAMQEAGHHPPVGA